MDRSRGRHQKQQQLKQQQQQEQHEQAQGGALNEQTGTDETRELRNSQHSDQSQQQQQQELGQKSQGFPIEQPSKVVVVADADSSESGGQQTATRRHASSRRLQRQQAPGLEQSFGSTFVAINNSQLGQQPLEATASYKEQEQQQQQQRRHSPPSSGLARRSQTSGVQQQQPQRQARPSASLVQNTSGAGSSNSNNDNNDNDNDNDNDNGGNDDDDDEGQSLIDKSASCCSCCCCSCSFCCQRGGGGGGGGKGGKGGHKERKKQDNMAGSVRLVSGLFLAELIGTFLLVIIGDGTIASYVLSRREVDLFAACFAFGVGAMIATFTAAKISGAHINPAATLAFALDGRLKWKLVPVYMCAQYLGGFLAALVLMVNYAEAISSFDGGQRSAFGAANSTGHIFATYPGQWVSVWGSLLDQIVGTAVLLFSLSAVCDQNNSGLEERHQPIIVAFVIGLVCVAFNPNCGAIFNPARDLAPRLLTALFGYPAVWEPLGGLYWLTAGVLGPHVGAIVGLFAYKLLIGASLVNKREYELETGLDLSGGGGGVAASEQQLQQGNSLAPAPLASKQQRQPMAKFTHRHHHDSMGLGQSDINYGSAGQR